MPIYEYKCMDCGKKMEVIQKISDVPLTECENCSGRLKKLISHSSFSLKGSGWYVTDYAGKRDGKKTSEKIKEDSRSESAGPKKDDKKKNEEV